MGIDHFSMNLTHSSMKIALFPASLCTLQLTGIPVSLGVFAWEESETESQL